MNVQAGQIWSFDPQSGMYGDCQITQVDGYGQITARFYDNIGTERVGPIEESDLGYLISHDGPLSGDPVIEDDPIDD